MVFPKTKEDSSAGSAKSTFAGGIPSHGGQTRPGEAPIRLQAFMGQGTKGTGRMHFSGPTEIDCEWEGELVGADAIFIGPNAHIHGSIAAVEVIVRGTVDGDIAARGGITLLANARVEGNLTCQQLSIEPGVVFRGTSRMSAEQASDSRSEANRRRVVEMSRE